MREKMQKNSFQANVSVSALLFSFFYLLNVETAGAVSSEIKSVKWNHENGRKDLEIELSDSSPYHWSKRTDTNQWILEVPNAKTSAEVKPTMDLSSEDSPVKWVSTYRSPDQKSSRVVLQMRKNMDLPVQANGNKITVSFDKSDMSPNDPAISAVEEPIKVSQSAAQSAEVLGVGTQGSGQMEVDMVQPVAPAKAEMEIREELQSVKAHIGKKITLQVKEADLGDVFKLIGETSGFNIVLSDDVKGKISLSLVDVPWDLALETILNNKRLGAQRKGNILRIASLQSMTMEETEKVASKAAMEAAAPKVTKLFPVNYSDPTQLIPLLQQFLSSTKSPTAGGGGAAGGAAATSNIILDQRTNTLIVQETEDNIRKITRLIRLLDRQEPQIQIEARIVEASESFTNSMTGSLGTGVFNRSELGYGFGGFNGGLVSDVISNGTTFEDSPPSSANGMAVGLGLKLNKIKNFRLNALLRLSENEGKAKIVSSPRITVLNRQQANIVQGTPVSFDVVTVSGNVAQTNQTFQQANLTLGVTPTVTNDGNVLMNLQVQNNTPQTTASGRVAIANKSVNTQVFTENGSTIIIGGVYSQSETEAEGGIPFLRKIPLLGILFGTKTKSLTRTELFIFITPKILNETQSMRASAN